MEIMYVHDGSLGEPVVGTREQYRRVLAPCWIEWHRDDDTNLPLGDYIERSLDSALRAAAAEEIEELTAAGMSLAELERARPA